MGMVVWALLVHNCGFVCQQRVWKTFPGPGDLRYEDGIVWQYHFLVNLYIFLTISFHLRVDRDVWCFKHSWFIVVGLLVSRAKAKNFFWSRLSLLLRWSRLNMAFTGNFVYMAHGSIPLTLRFFLLLFFLSRFSFTNIHDSRDSRGRGRVSI